MELLLTPMPKSVELKTGELTGKVYCKDVPDGILYDTVAEELGKKGDIAVQFTVGKDDCSKTEEGYSIVVDEKSVTIFAESAKGHFYGMVTLKQLIRQFGDTLPCLEIQDEPRMRMRIASLELGHGLIYKKEWTKRWIREMALQKANYLYFNVGDSEGLLPELRPYYPNSFHVEDAKEICEYAKKYNIKLIPGVSIHGHWNELLAMEHFMDCREVMCGEETEISNVGNSICPNNPKALGVIRQLLDIFVDCFQPEMILVGGDEIYSVGGDAACRDAKVGIGKTGIILSNFIRFRDYLEGKGVKMGIWGDMIISISGENRYDGNVEEVKYKQSNMYLLDILRRNTIIFDWWYVGESEKSQKFFKENGFETIACTSTHACMMHFASPQQQINMWKLFRGACKYNLDGCMVTDWINMYGYQTEQTLFNHGAGLAMSWKGCDNNFIDGVTRAEFEKAFMLQAYNTYSEALREYFHLAGDLYGDLLKLFSVKNKGVALRKVFFYEDNPLLFWVKYSLDLQGKVDAYESAVVRMETLWEEIKKTVPDSGYLEALHMPALLHRYLLENYKIVDRMHEHYRKAAECQFTDKVKFAEELESCAEIIGELSGKTQELAMFNQWMIDHLGLGDLADQRIVGREENILKLQRYLRYLKKDVRPLPVLCLISGTLFCKPQDNWWKERIIESGRQEGEFRCYDVDRGAIYESMDWEIPLNR